MLYGCLSNMRDQKAADGVEKVERAWESFIKSVERILSPRLKKAHEVKKKF